MKFHQILKNRRKELGLTQQDIADLWGIKSVNVSDWENGRGMPETIRLPALAKRLKLTISELFGDADYQPIEKEDLRPETKAVILMMEEFDTEGRILAKHAVSEVLAQYKYNKRLAEAEPNIEDMINKVKDSEKRAVLQTALDAFNAVTRDSPSKSLKKAS